MSDVFHMSRLMPHAECWKASPGLIWTMVVTNSVTFLSYVSICATLLVLAKRTRRVIARDWAYFVVGFALFIVACGSTHLMEVITTWDPVFWLDATANIVTAVLSAWVAFMLIRRAATIGFGINDYAARLAAAERENQEMEESLLAAQRLEEWSRMSMVLGHEISNPLEAIQNMLYLIRSSEGSPEEVVKLAQSAEEETERVIEISRSTLSFFRESKEPQDVDLRAAAESVRFLVAPVLQSKGLTLTVASAGEVEVQAYPVEVRQVLLNLVRNACEATRNGGDEVRVEIASKGDGVEVVVADHGVGIDAAILPELFQFGASTKGKDGNGMGLWTVKHILAKHGGTVAVESKRGEGSRFSLWWPRRYALDAQRAAAGIG